MDESFLGCSQDVFTRNVVSSSNFCNRENWQSSVIYLAQELELAGLPSPCVRNSEGGEEGNLDIIRLVNTTWELLQNYKSCLKTVENLENHIRRITSDVDHLHSNASKQKGLLELRQREAFENLEKERKSNLQFQNSQQKLRHVKEEVRRLTNVLIERESRYRHESKRKDQEISKLKERLIKILTERTGKGNNFSVMGMDLSALVSKHDGKSRGRWSSEQMDQKREGELFKKIIQDFETKNHSLIKENTSLRTFVTSMVDCFKLSGVQISSKLDDSVLRTIEAQIVNRHRKATNDDEKQKLLSNFESEKEEFLKFKKEFLKELMVGPPEKEEEQEQKVGGFSAQSPQWSQGTISYTQPLFQKSGPWSTGVTIGPHQSLYNSRPSSRNSSRSRDGSVSRETSHRHPIPKRNSTRPRSANLSPVGTASRNTLSHGFCNSSSSRDGSLSPTQSNTTSRNSRSLPRMHQQKRRSLTYRMSPTLDISSKPPLGPTGAASPPLPPPPPLPSTSLSSNSRILNKNDNNNYDDCDDNNNNNNDDDDADDDANTSDFSSQLIRLGEYIERREKNQDLSDSEMEFHLENVRRAMNIANRRIYSSSEEV